MSVAAETTGVGKPDGATARTGAAIVKVLVLLGLVVWAFWPEFHTFGRYGRDSGDWAHVFVAPVGILLLALRRRAELRAALTRGSMWGVLLLVVGLGIYGVFTWPFAYAYPRNVAIIVVCAGVILAVCGGGVLKRCVPLLLLAYLSVPVGVRVYAALIIRLETLTLSATRVALDKLPRVSTSLDGTDIHYATADRTSVVALGEPRRGASLLATYVAVGVFVVFARIRPIWQVVLMALAAAPIAILCNFFRLLCWGLVQIYSGLDPPSEWPRAIATIAALLLAYLLFALGCWVLSCLLVESDGEEEEAEQAEAVDG